MRKTNIIGSATLFAAIWIYAGVTSAGPVYSCTTVDGKSVFQGSPCSVDSLDPRTETQTADALRGPDVVRRAVTADYAKHMNDVQDMMANDEKQNQALEQKGK